MKKIALVMSAFALLAFSGLARAEGDAPAADKTPAKSSKKTTKTTKTDDAAGTTATKTETKTEKTAK